MSTALESAATAEPHRQGLRETWPLERRDAVVLIGWFIGLTAVFAAVGFILTGPFDNSGLIRADADISQWFADRRTPRLDDLATLGAMLADTLVKIAVTALVAGAMLVAWRSWREPLMVIIPLILEASTFIVVTFIVGRPRPDVPRLEESPVDSSFPSGHTAAAAAYCAIAIVVWWRFRNGWIRAIAIVLVVAIPLIVGLSRTYSGMHYVTDVVAGVALGLVSVLAVWLLLRDRGEAPDPSTIRTP